jgi:hypothetical protein
VKFAVFQAKDRFSPSRDGSENWDALYGIATPADLMLRFVFFNETTWVACKNHSYNDSVIALDFWFRDN